MNEALFTQKSLSNHAAKLCDQHEPDAKSLVEIPDCVDFYWNDWILPVKIHSKCDCTYLLGKYSIAHNVMFT